MNIPASRLWYDIEACLSQIEAACTDASTVSAVQGEVASPGAHSTSLLTRGESVPGNAALVLPRSPSAALTTTQPVELARATGMRRHNPHGADIQELRELARTSLTTLRAQLDAALSVRDAYFVFYPLVIDTDERLARVPGYGVEWESLHSEWFKSDDGGDLFYDVIQQLLTEPETHPLVYEAFFVCMRRGFQGRLENADERAQLIAKIAERISVSHVPPQPPLPPPAHVPPGPWVYRKVGVTWAPLVIYGLTTLATIAVYFGIRAYGQ